MVCGPPFPYSYYSRSEIISSAMYRHRRQLTRPFVEPFRFAWREFAARQPSKINHPACSSKARLTSSPIQVRTPALVDHGCQIFEEMIGWCVVSTEPLTWLIILRSRSDRILSLSANWMCKPAFRDRWSSVASFRMAFPYLEVIRLIKWRLEFVFASISLSTVDGLSPQIYMDVGYRNQLVRFHKLVFCFTGTGQLFAGYFLGCGSIASRVASSYIFLDLLFCRTVFCLRKNVRSFSPHRLPPIFRAELGAYHSAD